MLQVYAYPLTRQASRAHYYGVMDNPLMLRVRTLVAYHSNHFLVPHFAVCQWVHVFSGSYGWCSLRFRRPSANQTLLLLKVPIFCLSLVVHIDFNRQSSRAVLHNTHYK